MKPNARGKLFSWSFSSLVDFEGCPARWAAKRYYCTTVEAESEEMRWGTRVHKAFEERIRDGKSFPEDFPTTYDPWARVLEKLPGEKFFEQRLAVDEKWEPCEFFAPGACGRGVVDLLVVNGAEAVIVDYKTGKQKTDETQLNLFCWFVGHKHPAVETFKYRYVWLKNNTSTGGELRRGELMGVETKMRVRVSSMISAWNAENFPCFPSGLCSWCPVEECVHWRPRR